MRVRITFAVEVNEHFRRALRAYRGETGLATRQEVVDWYRLNAESADDNVISEYAAAFPEIVVAAQRHWRT